MTFYAKLINRPVAFEGWFEKPKNRLFGHVRVNNKFKFSSHVINLHEEMFCLNVEYKIVIY